MDGTVDERRARLLGAILRHGRDAVSFQSLETGVVTFEDELGVVAYVDTGTAWLAVGSPLAREGDVPELSSRFVRAARSASRRVSFVGIERPELLPGCRALLLGEQPVHEPSRWAKTVAAKKSLREQLRRARAKGVTVRRVDPSELDEDSPLRMRVRELATAWLASRRIEPLGFLVALEPFHAMDEHRYFVAERAGEVIAFASAIPIPARDGFMLEDVLRDDAVPNGTVDLLFDAVIRDLAGSSMLTLGLAPFTGRIPPWLAALRGATRPLFDFVGLRSFKERLLPSRWDEVYLALPEGELAAAHVIECLRAFAGGSLIGFGVRSIVRHPSGPPWALVVPLIGWIGLRLAVAFGGGASYFGSVASTIVAWSALDVILAVLLFRAAMRPRSRSLLVATGVALAVAMRSALHVDEVGFGARPLDVFLRTVLLVAPLVGAGLLALATTTRRAFERRAHRSLPPLRL